MLSITMLVCTTIVAMVATKRYEATQVSESFTPPEYDAGAVEGNPQIDADSDFYSTMEIPLTDGSCIVSMYAAPKLDGDKLDVYFANSEENNVGLKLVIYNEEENIIGESGLVKTGEYIKSVMLNEKAATGQKLKAKILTYEDETYYSLGSAGAVLMIR